MWSKIFDKLLVNHPDKLDEIRHAGLVYYCLFQLVFAVFLQVFAFIRPQYFYIFTSWVILIIPAMAVTIYFAKINYRLTAKIFILVTFSFQCIYLFSIRLLEAVNIISLTFYLMTAVIAVFVIQIRWGIVLMLAGFVALYIDYLIYLFGDFGFDLIPVNIYDSFAINLFYVGFTFTFIAFTAYSFKKYFYLYNHELRKKNLLNEELIANNQELNKLYQALENYTEALEESSKRLEEYAWMNAHKVRAPLARIQGLLLIIHLQKQTDERIDIDAKLNEAALELDSIVREMNELLEVLPKPLPST